jgi:hypothetical protein
MQKAPRPGNVLVFRPDSELGGAGIRRATVVSVDETLGAWIEREARAVGTTAEGLVAFYATRGVELAEGWQDLVLPVVRFNPCPAWPTAMEIALYICWDMVEGVLAEDDVGRN